LAFNLIAEFHGAFGWNELLTAIRPVPAGVECFPVPAVAADEPDALGVSLLVADAPTWAGFVALAARLWARGGVRVFELYSGSEVTPGTLPVVRRLFIG
jgi:hypothetical protein